MKILAPKPQTAREAQITALGLESPDAAADGHPVWKKAGDAGTPTTEINSGAKPDALLVPRGEDDDAHATLTIYVEEESRAKPIYEITDSFAVALMATMLSAVMLVMAL